MFPARPFAASPSIASAFFACLFPLAQAQAQDSSGCAETADVAVLASPIAPWKGAPLRVLVAADRENRIGFSMRPHQGIFDGGTVAYTALQLLVFLCARNIYLLGFDLSAQGSLVRFYEKENEGLPCWLDVDYRKKILPSFTLAGQICEKAHILLRNATLNSRLPHDVIPKMGYDELYNRSANAPNPAE